MSSLLQSAAICIAVDVAELQVECTHKILLAIPALSNGVLSHLAKCKVDEHTHWLVWSKHRQEQSHLFLISSQVFGRTLSSIRVPIAIVSVVGKALNLLLTGRFQDHPYLLQPIW